MQSVRERWLPLAGGVVLGVAALLLLTAASECEPTPNGPLPWPTPTTATDPQAAWEQLSGWTWQNLQDYVGDIAVEASGGGAGEVAGTRSLPAEGDVLANGVTVICSNPETGIYVIQLASLPTPPAPLEGEFVNGTPVPLQHPSETSIPTPALSEGDNAVSC